MLTEVNIDQDKRLARGRREIKGGYEVLEVPLPCVISVKTACNEPRFMDFNLRSWAEESDRITIWDAASLATEPDHIGLLGSPTVVTGLAEAPHRDRRREFLTGTQDEIVQELAEILKRSL